MNPSLRSAAPEVGCLLANVKESPLPLTLPGQLALPESSGGNVMRFLLVITILLLAATAAYPQRCGDSLLLYLRDQNGKVIAPSDFSSAKVSASYTVENADLADAEPQIKELPQAIKAFSVRTVCGMKRAEFRLKNNGQEMTIRVLNVPGDAGHILMDGIVFRKGTYEVDLGNRPMQNVESYEGPADPTGNGDEIKWVIKDKSLKKVG